MTTPLIDATNCNAIQADGTHEFFVIFTLQSAQSITALGVFQDPAHAWTVDKLAGLYHFTEDPAGQTPIASTTISLADEVTVLFEVTG